MNRQIVAFSTMTSQPPIPQRVKRERLRALPQFSVIVAWVVSAILHHRGQDVSVVNLDSVAPALVDQVSEATLQLLAGLDPNSAHVARHRARQTAGEMVAQFLHASTSVELEDPEVIRDFGNRLADAVLERQRLQLIYGGEPLSVARN